MPDKNNKPSDKKETPKKDNITKEIKTIEKPEPTGWIKFSAPSKKKDEKKK